MLPNEACTIVARVLSGRLDRTEGINHGRTFDRLGDSVGFSGAYAAGAGRRDSPPAAGTRSPRPPAGGRRAACRGGRADPRIGSRGGAPAAALLVGRPSPAADLLYTS